MIPTVIPESIKEESEQGTKMIGKCVILLCGCPGSGKSKFMRMMVSSFNSIGIKSKSISYDEESLDRSVWNGTSYKLSRNRGISALQRALKSNNSNAKLIIVDDTMHLRSMRREVYVTAREEGHSIICIHVSINIELALSRNDQRPESTRVDRTTLLRIFQSFQPLRPDLTAEKFQVTVDGTLNYEKDASMCESIMMNIMSLISLACNSRNQKVFCKEPKAMNITINATSENIVHKLDLKLRKCVSAILKKFNVQVALLTSDYVQSQSRTSKIVNDLRSDILRQSREELLVRQSHPLDSDVYISKWEGVFFERTDQLIRIAAGLDRPAQEREQSVAAPAPAFKKYIYHRNLDFDIPKDADNPRFTQSFSIHNSNSFAASNWNSAALSFFENYGFVVFRDVFSSEDCESTREAMWDIIESSSPGLRRDKCSTWGAYKSSGKYGLSMRGPCFHPSIVNNRQNPKLAMILRLLIGDPNILVSHDRFTIYRATEVLGGEQLATGPKNLHLDLNPWWWADAADEILTGIETLQYIDEQDFIKENNLVVRSMGKHLQCVLNFADNEEVDGGTILVPQFHKCAERWCADNIAKKKPLPWVILDDNDALFNYAKRVPMSEGSVLIWDQTIFHGTAPNKSSHSRMAQFLKAFPRSSVSVTRLARRTEALVRSLQASGAINIITSEGSELFNVESKVKLRCNCAENYQVARLNKKECAPELACPFYDSLHT